MTSPHGIKIATPLRSGGATFYVVECRCGWSSPLCSSKGIANAAYKEHKTAGAKAA